jgi:N-acylneuraminate cytidylyltransferase
VDALHQYHPRVARTEAAVRAPRRRITVAIIPARAGSKGLPRKNRKRIGGASLVELAVAAAKRSGVCDLCLVSSDDSVVLAQARRVGAVAIERPARLATDRSRTIDAVVHAIDAIEAASNVRCDPIVILEPTAPLRAPDDIRAAVELNLGKGRPNVFSASLVQDAEWLFRLGTGGRAIWSRTGNPSERRQDQRAMYVPNPIVYVLTRARLTRPWRAAAVAYPTPAERSVEIDDAQDLWVARALSAARARRRLRTR